MQSENPNRTIVTSGSLKITNSCPIIINVAEKTNKLILYPYLSINAPQKGLRIAEIIKGTLRYYPANYWFLSTPFSYGK